MFKPPQLRSRQLRNLRHWGMELVVVVLGVLLALWAQEWAEGRREAREHAGTLERLDALITRTQAISSVRVATSTCLKSRIAALDAELTKAPGAWSAMPLKNLPKVMNAHLVYPIVYLAESIDVPLEQFELAEQNGSLAALSPSERRQYDAMRQNVRWIAINWESGAEKYRGLGLLGVDGQLDWAARYDLRQKLAALSDENQVAVLRALSLGRQIEKAGLTLSENDRGLFSDKLAFARQVYGDCVVDVDPASGMRREAEQ